MAEPTAETPKNRQPERPTVPKPSETKHTERPLSQEEQKIVNRIDQDGDPDKVLEDIAGGIDARSPNPRSSANQNSGSKTASPREPLPNNAVIDMVKSPDGKWVTRAPEDPNFLYTTKPGNQTTDNQKAQAEEADRTNNQPHQETISPRDRWRAAEQRDQHREAQRQQELGNLQSEGERLASLVYTPEGQQQVAQVRTTITQIVDATTKQPKLETVHPGFDRSPVAIAEVRQRNEQLLQAWQQRKTARIEALLRGETMTHLEANAYLAQILNREPLPTRDIEESNRRQNLLDQFNRQRQVIGRMLLYRDSEQLPIGSRYLLVNARRLEFYKISTNEAQISFAKGWDGTKNSLQEKSTNPNHVTSSEARIILEQLNSVQQTGTALNNLLHEPVQFSTYSEAIANFVRFRARIGERLFLGTNHEHSQAEMQFIDSYIEDIVNRHITVVFIEQGGLTAKDNLDRWLYENGYTQTANTVVGELSHLAQDLSSKGIRVLNMDLRFNPSALPFALKRFGLERTIRDLNWDLSFKAASFLNADTAQMDQNRIPEIITRLIIQAGGQTTQEQVASLIQGRDWTNDDYFTDSDREEYMANIIQGEKIAVAAHSAHTSALLARLYGNQQVDNLNISTDLNKIDRVVAETKRRSSN